MKARNFLTNIVFSRLNKEDCNNKSLICNLYDILFQNMNPFFLRRNFQSLHDIFQFLPEECVPQNFYKFICQKVVLCTLFFWTENYKGRKVSYSRFCACLTGKFSTSFQATFSITSIFIGMSMVWSLGTFLSCALNAVWIFGPIFCVILKWSWIDHEFYFSIRGRSRGMALRKVEMTIKYKGKTFRKCCNIWPETRTLFWFWTVIHWDWKFVDEHDDTEGKIVAYDKSESQQNLIETLKIEEDIRQYY